MQRGPITIAANSNYHENVRGKVFALISATAAVDVELDNRGKETVLPGRKLAGEAFTRIRIFETSGADNIVTFYVGEADITLPTLSSDGSSSSQQEASTYTKAYTSNSLNPGASANFSGIDATTGKQRKQIVVSNGDAGQVLQILDSAGRIGALIQPGQTFTMVTNGYIRVKNPNGGAVAMAVLETFYS